jgi:endoglucanase
MKQMMSFCSRFGAACAIGAILVGSGVGVAVAQGWWQSTNQPSSAPGERVVNRAYFPVKRCINLASALEAPREGEWGYTIRERDLRAIRDVGFDTIRVPIKWSAHASQNAPYTINPAFFARIDQVMTWGLQANLTIIINVHHYDELFKDPDRHEPRLIALWSQIAARYRTAPPNVIFEIINEPQEAFTGERVNITQTRALAAIRQTNPTRTVIFAGDEWGNINGMDNLKLPNDPYLVGTVHYYQPFEFTHQGATWMDEAPPSGRLWPRRGEFDTLHEDIQRMAAFRTRLGAPVLMGEYGVDNAVPMAQRALWTRDITRAFKEIDMPTCYFNFASGFATYDLEREQWHQSLITALELK